MPLASGNPRSASRSSRNKHRSAAEAIQPTLEKSTDPLLRGKDQSLAKLNGKRRRRSIIAFEMLRLDRGAKEPLHQQLYRQIRDELVSGRFNHNSARLPSSRALAAELGIARLTVKLAFERLLAEGYLEAKTGSGTFVADKLPETMLISLARREAT